MKTSEICKDERRRSDVRESPLRGLDYVEVSDDQLTLTVYFLGKAPDDIDEENVRIEGGRRIRNIQVLDVDVHYDDDPEADDYMEVTVDRPGDFSTYTLRLVERDGYDKQGHPRFRRFTGCDNRYAEVDFSFKVSCPSDFDCATDTTCPPPVYEHPEINYLAKDYASLRQLILDRLALTIPGWQERHVPDVGIALVEILAYVGDYLSYHQDAVATEAYLGTARQRISVHRHARLVDYFMHEGNNARTWLSLNTSEDILATSDFKIAPADIYFITDPEGTLSTDRPMVDDADVQKLPTGTYEAFELLLETPKPAYLNLYAAHNEIRFYTWGDQQCCLPRGATSATLQDYAFDPTASPDADEQAYILSEIAEDEALEDDEDEEPPATTSSSSSASQAQQPKGQVGQSGQVTQEQSPTAIKKKPRVLHLKPGDFLLLEEVRGANTGLAQDVLVSHRQVVRLTKVEKARDALYNKKVLEIEWAAEDALLFPLCISAIGRAPDCILFQNISVARGNLFLIDNGVTVSPLADNWSVQVAMTIPHCEGEQQPSDVQVIARPFNPTLSMLPLTYSQPLSVGRPASQLLAQEIGKTIPQIQLMSLLPPEDAEADPRRTWTVQPDLLESEPDNLSYVVEMDNDGYAHLRFGDDNLGRAPEPNEQFSATYRIGNGPTGNIGAETLAHIVFRKNKPDGITLTPRNPFAADGGTLPEPIAQVKQIAPKAFRDVLERAITAGDYATLAQLYPGVQRAAAALRWNGSGYDVLVVIDPPGTEMLSDTLRDGITLYLEQYRRIGHDVAVRQAEYVPIELAMCVVVQPHYLRGHVEADLLKRLGNGVLPDGSKGFFHPDNLSFGNNIAVSMLVAVAQAVQGVLAVEVTTLQRFGQGPNQELQMGVLEIGPLEIAQLDNDPSFPEHGILTLTLKGGR